MLCPLLCPTLPQELPAGLLEPAAVWPHMRDTPTASSLTTALDHAS